MDLGPFPEGMDNRSKDHAIKPGAVRNAVNADIGPDGRLSRRKGMARVYSGMNIRGSFGCPGGQFFIEGEILKQFNGSGAPSTVLVDVLGDYCAHEYKDGVIYFSDGSARALIVDGVPKQWGLPAPSTPLLSGGAGSLGAGTYVAAIAYVNADGGQSALSEVATITVTDNSSITFSSLPGVPAGLIEDPVALRLFMSSANGEMMYRVADIGFSVGSRAVAAAEYTSGYEIEWAPMGPPPGAKLIRYYKGRMYLLDPSGLICWYSQPLNYHLFDLGSDYLIFNQPVTVMEPSGSGIYFANDEVHQFYMGTPEDGFDIIDKLDYGAPFNEGCRIDEQDSVTWQTHHGKVTGGPDGSISNTQEDRVAVDKGTAAANIIREHDGQRQFITSVKGAATNKMAATSWITAEVIRRA